MADRVATMSRGLVQQVASPADLYAHPTNLFGQGMSRMRSSTVLRRRLGTCDWRSISSSSWAAMYWCICSPTPQQQRVISSPFAAEDAAQIASPAAGARLLARSNPLSRIARRGCRRIHRRYPAGAPVRPGVWKRIERVVSAGIDVLEPVVVDSSRLRHAETVPDAMPSSWLTVRSGLRKSACHLLARVQGERVQPTASAPISRRRVESQARSASSGQR